MRISYIELLFDHNKIEKTASQYGFIIQEKMSYYSSNTGERSEGTVDPDNVESKVKVRITLKSHLNMTIEQQKAAQITHKMTTMAVCRKHWITRKAITPIRAFTAFTAFTLLTIY